MTGPEVSAMAALAGSAIGGCTSILSNYVIQRGTTARDLLSKELNARQALYAEFIASATKVYFTAKTTKLSSTDELSLLYSLISRIRLIASEPVIEAAESFAQEVTRSFAAAALTIDDLEAEVLPKLDPLHMFSSRCRDEFRLLLGHKEP